MKVMIRKLKRARTSLVGLVLVLALPGETMMPATNATLGGPRVADILGYDPVDRKVYYMYAWRDESSRLPQLYYLALAGPKPEQAVAVRSLYKGQEETFFAQLKKLRERLVPLTRPKTETMSLTITITKSDIERISSNDTASRFFMAVELAHHPFQSKFEVKAYCRRQVGLVDWYLVPGEKYAVANFTYTGNPVETCYETQTVALLSETGGQ
jgi:hypothetical protein